MKTIKEKNIMLAEYLKWDKKDNFYFKTAFIIPHLSNGEETNIHSFEDLRFHTSWDWLMTVVEAVNKDVLNMDIIWNGVVIKKDIVHVYARDYNTSYAVGKGDGKYDNLKNCVYNAVTDFVEWKNQDYI